MSANSFGNLFVLHSFGESHGTALGAIIDGCPADIEFDHELLLHDLDRRRPGAAVGVSQRRETDQPEILSGIFEGKTLGTPIAVIVRNQDQRSADYDQFKITPRAGHADDVWKSKFGHSDHRGGGRSSGRETLARVIGGAVAKMLIRKVSAKTLITGSILKIGPHDYSAEHSAKFLQEAQTNGESWGGIVQVKISNPPAGLGQPVFHKLKSELAAAMMSIGATSGVEFGEGFKAAQAKGTEFHQGKQNVYGGIRGGISTGEEITIQIAFKPTSSILDVAKKGRHDPCIVIRALPVCEAMAALVLADQILWQRLDK